MIYDSPLVCYYIWWFLSRVSCLVVLYYGIAVSPPVCYHIRWCLHWVQCLVVLHQEISGPPQYITIYGGSSGEYHAWWSLTIIYLVLPNILPYMVVPLASTMPGGPSLLYIWFSPIYYHIWWFLRRVPCLVVPHYYISGSPQYITIYGSSSGEYHAWGLLSMVPYLVIPQYDLKSWAPAVWHHVVWVPLSASLN